MQLASHPTYFAYFLIFAITLCLYQLYYGGAPFSPPVVITVIIFFFAMLMLTGGRTSFISFLLIASFFLLKYLVDRRGKMKTVVFCLVCVLIAVLFVFNSIDYSEKVWPVASDHWERIDLWKAGLEVNPDPLFGVGIGGSSEVLNRYYQSHGLVEAASESFNTHNQFVQTYLSNGLFGLIALLLLLGRPVYLALRFQYPWGVLFFFPFFIYGVTEVFLGRYQGIVFFAFISQLFVLYCRSSRAELALKESRD